MLRLLDVPSALRLPLGAVMAEQYSAFLTRKLPLGKPEGIDVRADTLHASLFPFQRHSVQQMLRQGRGAVFLDTGLGKTLVQLEWARVVAERTSGPVLILTPLAVAHQTVAEGARFGIRVQEVRDQSETKSSGLYVTNYEKLDNFDPGSFTGVVLDESSILKAFSGATRRRLCEAFSATPFRLACTATPAPNDHVEIGNHAEFLGLMRMNEMLQRWFVNDASRASQVWRLKKHAIADFWDWVSSWAVCASRPSDLGDDDANFVLPALDVQRELVVTDLLDGAGEDNGQYLAFRIPGLSATGLHQEKRRTVQVRARRVAELIAAESNEPWLVWCDTDYEADALTAAIPDALEVRGSMPQERKEQRLIAFCDGAARVLVTKPRVAGFGLNLQHCAHVAFVGVSYSYEQYYQAIRRCWRFGQRRPVHVHVVMAATEERTWQTVQRKAEDHETMKLAMYAATRRAAAKMTQMRVAYRPDVTADLPRWL